ncbi:MAG: cellulase family glycosylhydrolase [Bdellovibrionota bacterium]
MKLLRLTFLAIAAALYTTQAAYALDCRGVNVSHIVTSQQIDALGGWGVNCIRYPLFNPEEDTDNAEQYDAWLDTQIRYVDRLIPALKRNGMRMVLELYSGPGGHTVNSNNGGKKPQQALFAYPWAQSEFLNAWQKLAAHYVGEDAIAAYEIFNEWQMGNASAKSLKKIGMLPANDLAYNTAVLIRQIDSVHPIIVDTEYGNPVLATKLKKVLKSGIPGIVISAHLYAPASFTHQGIYGYATGVQYPTKNANRKKLMSIVKSLVKVGKTVGQQNIFLGEFGVSRFADEASASRYLEDVTSIVQQYGWSDAVLGYGDHGPFDFSLNASGAPATGPKIEYLRSYLRSK